jgi:hypothetical protein
MSQHSIEKADFVLAFSRSRLGLGGLGEYGERAFLIAGANQLFGAGDKVSVVLGIEERGKQKCDGQELQTPTLYESGTEVI